MLTNTQMKANRYAHWHNARRRIAAIQKHLDAGHTVYICTMTHSTKLTKKHRDMVKATKSGAYVQAGKRWDNIDFCGIKVYG